ncbi:MAG: D-tyrosyl-tRNA(Tyr) deacylase [Erysipelothrix sp.]|jgi:D-tyrosyl-tRNA(Tyr) deacylase|nr:D-tyrosyl-tRNA(Tyr) deacylase [Erysipelothrix sp.]
MKVIVQRSQYANVSVSGDVIAEIERGMVLLVGICRNDTVETVQKMAHKVANLRIFSDENDKMNLNIQQVQQDILSVSQFTLCASTKKGHRPSFDGAMPPGEAQVLYDTFNEALRAHGMRVKTGVFKAYMQVLINNDGPLTFHLEMD